VSKLSFRWRFATIAIAIALVSIPTSLILFPPNFPAGFSLPVPAIALVLGLKAFEGLALGTGIAFLMYGYPLLKRAGESHLLTLPAYLAIGWYLVNWWPHDNLHLVNGLYLWGLIGIEYGFHLTLMIAAGLLAFFFYRVIRLTPMSGRPSE
jgi:hypothetical protein